MREDELFVAAKELQAPYELVKEVAEDGKLPVVNFVAGGISTPADAALVMQLGAEGVFVGSGIFKSEDPARMANAIVQATTHFQDDGVGHCGRVLALEDARSDEHALGAQLHHERRGRVRRMRCFKSEDPARMANAIVLEVHRGLDDGVRHAGRGLALGGIPDPTNAPSAPSCITSAASEGVFVGSGIFKSEALAKEQVGLTSDALQLFVDRLPRERGVARQEIERLVLYLGPGSGRIAAPEDLEDLDPFALKSDLAAHLSMLHELHKRRDEFDVLHFHVDLIHFPFFAELAARTVTTLHGRLDLKDLPEAYARWRDYPLVSISDAQRAPLPEANWLATIPHGLAATIYTFNAAPRPPAYLAFLGRISPEKRPDRAIEIARRSGMPLKIAAKVDAADRRLLPRGDRTAVRRSADRVRGRDRRREKPEFLGGARRCCSRSTGRNRSAW